jgi:methionyl-tRNA formyltransferase
VKVSFIIYIYIFFTEIVIKELNPCRQDGRMISKLSVVVPAPKPNPCLVANYAKQHNLPISVWPLPKESQAQTDCWDFGVVASFGHLIPSRIINSFPL